MYGHFPVYITDFSVFFKYNVNWDNKVFICICKITITTCFVWITIKFNYFKGEMHFFHINILF